MESKFTKDGFWCKPSKVYYKLRNKLVITIFFSLVVVLTFNLGLVFFTLKSIVSDLVINQNRVISDKINVQLFSNNEIDTFNLSQIQDYIVEMPSSVEVLDVDYSSMYVSENTFSTHTLTSIVDLIKQKENQEKQINSFTIDGDLISFFPLLSATNKKLGYIVFTTPNTYITQQVTKKIITNIKIALVVIVLTIFVIFQILQHIYIRKKSKNIKKKTLIAIFLVIIMIPQIGISIYNAGSIYKGYQDLVHQRKIAVENLIQSQNINEFANKEEFSKKLDSYLQKFVMIGSVSVFDKKGDNWIIKQKKEKHSVFFDFFNKRTSLESKSRISVADETGVERYYFTVKENKSFIFTNIRRVFLNLFTTLILSALLLLELLLFLFSRKIEVTSFQKEEDDSRSVAIRALAFLTIFTMDMVISFLPLYIDGLYKEPIFGLGKDFFRPLPIVCELFFVTIAISTSRKFIINSGWQYPLFLGIFLIGLGNVFSYLSTSIIPFILSRGFIGFGYGLSYVAFNSYLITKTEKNKRSQGFAHLGSAIVTGTIVGGLTGGILADNFGRQAIFLFNLVPLSVLLLWLIFVMNKEYNFMNSLVKRRTLGKNEITNFIRSRQVWPNLFLLSMPFTLLLVGFTQYSIPVYLGERGYSNADIARSIMLYGTVSIICFPLAGKWIDKLRSSYPALALAAFLTSGCFFLFIAFEGYYIVLLVLGIFALGAILSESARPVHILEQEISLKIGEASAISILSTVERIGGFLGPLFFRVAAIFFGLQYSFVVVGIVIGVLYLLFFIISKPPAVVRPRYQINL